MKRCLSTQGLANLCILFLFSCIVHAQCDGVIFAWGRNNYGQCNVPAPNSGFVAIAAGANHSLGLKGEWTIVAQGFNSSGQCDVPAPNIDFVAVAGGMFHSLGLKSDGTVVAWGNNTSGQCDIPAPNSGFIAIAGGECHNLGLKSDGTIVAWGDNYYGQCSIPAPNSEFTAISGGSHHSLCLKSDGTILAWGDNYYGQCDIPAPNSDFMAVAAGGHHSLCLKRSYSTAVEETESREMPGTEMLTIVSLSPNPFSQSTGISFETPASGHITMEIYDLSGRSIRTIPLGHMGSGLHQTCWYGCDETGDNVTSGIYFVRLFGNGGESQTARAVLIR